MLRNWFETVDKLVSREVAEIEQEPSLLKAFAVEQGNPGQNGGRARQTWQSLLIWEGSVATGAVSLMRDGSWLNRSRLRVDTRKWLMSKMLPRKYGDKMALTGGDGGPIVVQTISYDDAKDTPH